MIKELSLTFNLSKSGIIYVNDITGINREKVRKVLKVKGKGKEFQDNRTHDKHDIQSSNQ